MSAASLRPRRALRAVGEPDGGRVLWTKDQSSDIIANRGSVTVFRSPAAAVRATQQGDSIFGSAGPITDEQAKNHALRRVAFGARPSDRAEIDRRGVSGWISDQVYYANVADPLGAAVAAHYHQRGTTIAQVVGSLPRYDWASQYDTTKGTLARRLYSSRQLHEVMGDVMANHLHVPLPSDNAWSSAADYHATVLRPNALGRYDKMLKAALRHPALLSYFDNDVSNPKAVNENLGREVLELHSVGVEAKYSESDVLNSARILSGRSIVPGSQEFVFTPSRHWTGKVQVLGFSHANSSAEDGMAVGDAYIDYLANHPATARMIARKLALRFVSDKPSDDLVELLAEVYLVSETRLDSTVWALFCSNEFWASIGAKVRRPQEDVVATFRALDFQDTASAPKAVDELYWRLQALGDRPFAAHAQRGYPDQAESWMSSEGFIGLWTLHRGLAGGWWAGMQPSGDAFLPRGQETIGQWIDRLCMTALGIRPQGQFRSTLVQFSGAKEQANAQASGQGFRGHLLMALMFDSPYFRTR